MAVVVDGVRGARPGRSEDRRREAGQVEDTQRRREFGDALIEFVVHEQVFPVFAPPTRMNIAHPVIGVGTEQLRAALIAQVPKIEGGFREIEEYFAGIVTVAAGGLARVFDHHGGGIVGVVAFRVSR